MANAFSYAGVDTSGATYGLTLLDMDFQSLAAPLTITQPVAQWFGGVNRCGGYGSRMITLQVVVTGSTAADLLTKLDALQTLLDPRLGEQNLQLDWIAGRYWKAMLSSSIDLSAGGVLHKQFSLQFVAADSRGYSTTTRSTPDFTITTNPQTLTVESGPTAVVGTAPADCVWVIKNTGSASSSVTLNNTTTSESVTWTGTLSTGHWLRIDTLRGVLEKSTDSGATYTTAMTGIAGSFVFPTLKGGVSNSVTLTGIAGGSVVLTYTARYL